MTSLAVEKDEKIGSSGRWVVVKQYWKVIKKGVFTIEYKGDRVITGFRVGYITSDRPIMPGASSIKSINVVYVGTFN